jgi:hypothetical protein
VYATALIGLAWLLVVVPAALQLYVARFTGFLGTGAELLRVTSVGALVAFVFEAVALVLMLIVLWQVEKLQRAKAASVGVARTASPTVEEG